MAWTEITRRQHDRRSLRYASDCTDAEWALVAPFMPAPSKVGRPRTTDLREVWNAIQYRAATGCQWALLPKDFPPFTTVQHYFYWLRDSGVLDILNETLAMAARLIAGRGAEPTAGIIDSQSVKTPESGGPRGYDAGKKINGKKRHILVDTIGLLLHAVVHPADIQDRDGGVLLLSTLFGMYPFLARKLFADAGYQGPQFATAVAQILPHLGIEIVKRSDQANGFVVLPMRWVVERTLAWLNRCRRLAKDFENLSRTALAFLQLASIRLMLRKLCNPV